MWHPPHAGRHEKGTAKWPVYILNSYKSFLALRPPASGLGRLYVGFANPGTVAVCGCVDRRRSDIVAPCLGKRQVVSSLLRKEIILIVNQHSGKLTAEFVVRLEVTHEAKDNDKKRKTQKTLTPVIARRKVNTRMT